MLNKPKITHTYSYKKSKDIYNLFNKKDIKNSKEINNNQEEIKIVI